MRIQDPQVLEEISMILKAMADPTRMQLLQALLAGEKAVNELVEAVGTSQANVSKHLALLKRARLVAARREGTQMVYRIAAPFVTDVCEVLCRGISDRLSGQSQLRRKVRRLLEQNEGTAR